MRADDSRLGLRFAIDMRRLGAAALCAFLVSACDGLREWEQERNAVALGLSNPEVRHPIGFVAREESLDVEVPAGARGLSPNQQVDVYRFLYRHRREATGPLAIVLPARGGDTAVVRRSLRDIRGFAADAGIASTVQRAALQDGRAGIPRAIRLAYQRPLAVPPICDQWTEDVGRNEPRVPYPNWGCATQRNLALMVDNARDLHQPQAEDPRASERRGVTWSSYVGGSAAPTSEG